MRGTGRRRPVQSIDVKTRALAVLIAVLLLAGVRPHGAAAPDLRLFQDRVWFAPAPGSPDLRRLFEVPEEWRRARSKIQVFKFYQQHTDPAAPPIVGPNTYQALARADAFRRVGREWGMRLALEVGAVKEFYCTPDGSGMRDAVAATLRSVAAIRDAGGIVSYLAMDEPFIGGLSPRCGAPHFERTADRLRTYISEVRRAHPVLRIGLIEAYPTFSPAQFAAMLQLMTDRGTPPAFLHADVDLNAMRSGQHEFGRDMIRLAELAESHGIPFGVIVWGHDGDADARYAADARELADAVHRTFRHSSVLPAHVIFQSWAESSSGQRVTPANLPESRANTHTWLVNTILDQLRGGYGGGR